MIKQKLILILILAGFTVFSKAQIPVNHDNETTADTAAINVLLQQSKEQLSKDPEKAISLAIQARDMATKINFLTGKAYALKNIGLGHNYKGNYLEALGFWNESLQIF